jgi:hypothetical protein
LSGGGQQKQRNNAPEAPYMQDLKAAYLHAKKKFQFPYQIGFSLWFWSLVLGPHPRPKAKGRKAFFI